MAVVGGGELPRHAEPARPCDFASPRHNRPASPLPQRNPKFLEQQLNPFLFRAGAAVPIPRSPVAHFETPATPGLTGGLLQASPVQFISYCNIRFQRRLKFNYFSDHSAPIGQLGGAGDLQTELEVALSAAIEPGRSDSDPIEGPEDV